MSRRRKNVQRRAQKRAVAEVEESEAREGAGRATPSGPWFALVMAATIAAPIVFVSVLLLLSRLGGQSGEPSTVVPSAAPRAVIVDQLGLTQPNPTFVETATGVLEQAGYIVDYYPEEEVTVEFCRKAPVQPYELIIFRVHSALGREDDRPADWATLFTADAYRETWYVEEQKTRRLSKVPHYKDGPAYFGIMSDFVRSSMKGDLRGATVVMMGCDGPAAETIAAALVEKGAKAVVSWNGLVPADHTDSATEGLLRHLATEKLTLREAVDKTAAEVGPDRAYGSVLRLYPPPSSTSMLSRRSRLAVRSLWAGVPDLT